MKTQPLIVLGKPLTLTSSARKSAAHPVPDTHLHWGGRRINIDRIDSQRLSKLLPPGYANATAEQWVPFVKCGIELGLL